MNYKHSSTLTLPTKLKLPKTSLKLYPPNNSKNIKTQNHYFKTLTPSLAFKTL